MRAVLPSRYLLKYNTAREFKMHIAGKGRDSCCIVAIDISNMFTNIPREMGIRQCTEHLAERSIVVVDCLVQSVYCITKALEIALDYNVAAFNSITYRQERGQRWVLKTDVSMQTVLWMK